MTLDWGSLQAAGLGKPWILAGGLTAGNVAAAIRAARPYGVDVASGVESVPGIKDPKKVKSFIKIAKEEFGIAS
jgi:phosphoribosylanthranilate isomerase